MGSVGFGELLFIGVVALVVFGPRRLPEIARRAGELLTKARNATKDFTDSIDAEYGGKTSPIRDLQDEYNATKDQLSETAAKLTDMTTVDFDDTSDGEETDTKGSTSDADGSATDASEADDEESQTGDL
jgi:sec-independent protein translocase protein TatB